MIRTDQSARFGSHVIRGLTEKFNHQRVKVYHLHVFQDSRYIFYTQPQRERGVIQISEAFQTTPQWTDKYTNTPKVILKYPFWQKYSGKHSRLCLKLMYTAEKERAEQLCFLHDNLPFLNWED